MFSFWQKTIVFVRTYHEQIRRTSVWFDCWLRGTMLRRKRWILHCYLRFSEKNKSKMLNLKSVQENLLQVMLKSAKETRQMEQAMAKSNIFTKRRNPSNYQSIHLRVFWVQYARRCQFHTQTVSSFVRSQRLVVDLHSAMYEQNCNSTNDLDWFATLREKT